MFVVLFVLNLPLAILLPFLGIEFGNLMKLRHEVTDEQEITDINLRMKLVLSILICGSLKLVLLVIAKILFKIDFEFQAVIILVIVIPVIEITNLVPASICYYRTSYVVAETLVMSTKPLVVHICLLAFAAFNVLIYILICCFCILLGYTLMHAGTST